MRRCGWSGCGRQIGPKGRVCGDKMSAGPPVTGGHKEDGGEAEGKVIVHFLAFVG